MLRVGTGLTIEKVKGRPVSGRRSVGSCLTPACVWPAGKILDRLLVEQRPLVVLELGAHCGYSSVRIARALPLGGRLYTVEMDQGNAGITEKILRLAGFDDDTVRGRACLLM